MKTIESALADDHMRHVNGDLLGTLELIDACCCPCRAWPDRRPRLCYIYRSLTEAAVLGAYPRLFGHSLDTKKRKPWSKQVKTGKLWKSGRGRMNPTPARENRRIPTIPAGWAEPLHVGSSPTGGTTGGPLKSGPPCICADGGHMRRVYGSHGTGSRDQRGRTVADYGTALR